MGLPEWVSKELFEESLKKYLKNKNLQILELTSSPALAVGENYTSDIFRTVIKYTTDEESNKKTLSVIVKCFPQVGLMVDLVDEMGLFETEVIMYSKVFPAIYELLGTPPTASAACIYSSISPHRIIIFEDLAPLGFKTAPRQQGVDLQHCLIVAEKLARLHATTMVLCEKDPSLKNSFTKAIFRDNQFTKEWITTGLNALSEACSTWPGYEKYSTKLKAIQDKVVEKVINAAKPKEGGLNVLNHGDAWINNFMFSYGENGKVKDFRFVDLQIAVYASPAIDLLYFWTSSPHIDVKKHHFDTFLDHYYQSFIETLTKIKCPQAKFPSREYLRKEFDCNAIYGLATSVTCFPMVAAPSRKDATIDEYMSNDSKDGFRHDVFNNEVYRRNMEYLLPYYDHLGVFD